MVSPVYIRPLLALLVAATLIGIVAVVLRNGARVSTTVPSVNQQLPHNIDIALKKARFTEIQDGLVAWELVAERVDYDKSGDTAYLFDIQMVFQRNRSHGAISVTAGSGEYVSVAKTVRLKGNVHVITEDGASFDTKSVEYSGETASFSTTAPVIFRQQRLQLTATGMDLNIKNQRARFHSVVDAVIVSR